MTNSLMRTVANSGSSSAAMSPATSQAAGKDHLIVAPADAVHFAPVHLFTLESVALADQ
jgi:hypothetical protein